MHTGNQKRSAFEKVLGFFSSGIDSADWGLTETCKTICDWGEFILKGVFLLSLADGWLIFWHGPIEYPKSMMLICCLGTLAAKFGRIGFGEKDGWGSLKFPIVVGAIVFFLPIPG